MVNRSGEREPPAVSERTEDKTSRQTRKTRLLSSLSSVFWFFFNAVPSLNDCRLRPRLIPFFSAPLETCVFNASDQEFTDRLHPRFFGLLFYLTRGLSHLSSIIIIKCASLPIFGLFLHSVYPHCMWIKYSLGNLFTK